MSLQFKIVSKKWNTTIMASHGLPQDCENVSSERALMFYSLLRHDVFSYENSLGGSLQGLSYRWPPRAIGPQEHTAFEGLRAISGT